jgi:hypothetical protein
MKVSFDEFMIGNGLLQPCDHECTDSACAAERNRKSA